MVGGSIYMNLQVLKDERLEKGLLAVFRRREEIEFEMEKGRSEE